MALRNIAGLFAAAILSAAAATAQTSGDADIVPKQHLKIERPGHLSEAEARAAYDKIAGPLARAYAAAREPAIGNYRRWRRYNNSPYRSSAHGNRYVNNYANGRAASYVRMETAGIMPPGAVLAKDSFTVTEAGGVFGAPIFVMQKLRPGASPENADWRYLMILPDGSLFGDSRGENADKVGFCHGCHEQMAAQDYLFLVPAEYRTAPGSGD